MGGDGQHLAAAAPQEPHEIAVTAFRTLAPRETAGGSPNTAAPGARISNSPTLSREVLLSPFAAAGCHSLTHVTLTDKLLTPGAARELLAAAPGLKHLGLEMAT
ncbi:hypothetical protein GPECTOR_16g736 [Gonium pectorale]|uniref:Uncharacterized protein n=1 Tax=Gonium pectorale TaxID=33097 RepID=A0A150GL90_GONPE|nr:hypothetical protein GPECTOR_16g736 [Gonium pectorale]|eukprot:KXZ50561.1 hypothetical protein GPECTOR_16g736 [Gonium pectorale]